MGYYNPEGICSQIPSDDPLFLCSGCSLTPDTYKDWILANCPLEYQRLYYTGNYETAQVYANNLLTRYEQLNPISSPNAPGYSPFQEVLRKFCANTTLTPGVCQNYLNYNFCPRIDYEDITDTDAEWCGCFTLPPEVDQELYGPNIACYPLCHLASTIQRVDNRGTLIQCDNQVCVIDNVSVDVVESSGGEVNIRSICPDCTGECTCVINNVQVTGVDLNITQYCGDNTTCYKTVGDEVIQVVCRVSGINWWLVVLIIIVVILAVTVVLVATYQAFKPALPPKKTHK
jgi:hypothetical protein